METKPIHAKPSLYAFYFEAIKQIGLKYGYNIVLHGSMNRDLDLIGIPWSEDLGNVDDMVNEVVEVVGGSILMQNREIGNLDGDRFSEKPHGRVVYVININRDFKYKFGGACSEEISYVDPKYYLDFSIIRPWQN